MDVNGEGETLVFEPVELEAIFRSQRQEGSFQWPQGTEVTLRRSTEGPPDWIRILGPGEVVTWIPEDCIEKSDTWSGRLLIPYSDSMLGIEKDQKLAGWLAAEDWVLAEDQRGNIGWVQSEYVRPAKSVRFKNLRAGFAWAGKAFAFLLCLGLLLIGAGLTLMGVTQPDGIHAMPVTLGVFTIFVCGTFLYRIAGSATRNYRPASYWLVISGGVGLLLLLATPLAYISITEFKWNAILGTFIYGFFGIAAIGLGLRRRKLAKGQHPVPPVAIRDSLVE